LPKNNQKIKERINSVRNAVNGLAHLFKGQANARLHLIATVAVITLGFLFKINVSEWALLVLAIGSVLAAELFNTSVEYLADVVSPEHNDKIKQVKDLAAGGVLIAAICSLVIGVIVFGPRIIRLLPF